MSEYPEYDAMEALERALEATKGGEYEVARQEAEAATSLIKAAELSDINE